MDDGSASPGTSPDDDRDLRSLDDTAADPRSFGPVTRILVRAAAADPRDLVARFDRVLYATIGFFVCFFGVYGTVALYVFFSRAGSASDGSTDLHVAVIVAAALLVAIAITLFDRSVVAQVNSALESMRPRNVRAHGDPEEGADETFLHPASKVTWKPVAGRVLIAFVIGFFATQAFEILLFSSSIEDQRVRDKRAQVEKVLASRQEDREDAQRLYESTVQRLKGIQDTARANSRKARHGQRGNCRPGTNCAQDLAESRRAGQALKELREPFHPDSEESIAVKEQQDLLNELTKAPRAVLAREPQDPLQDFSSLMRFLRGEPLAAVYYLALLVILMALDLAAILLKYTLARDSEYERRQALRQRARWRATADAAADSERVTRLRRATTAARAVSAEKVRHEEEEIRQATRKVELAALRDAIEKQRSHPSVAEAASERVIAGLVADLQPASEGRREAPDPDRPDTRSPTAVGLDEQRGAASPRPAVAAAPGVGEGAGGGSDDSPMIFELLGAAAGAAIVITLLGGVYIAGQLDEAGLPFEVLGAMSTRRILVAGIGAAVFLGIPVYVLSRLVVHLVQRLRSRTQAIDITWIRQVLSSMVRLAPTLLRDGVLRLLRRRPPPPSRKSSKQLLDEVRASQPAVDTDLSADLRGGAVVAVGAGTATVATENGLLALVAGGTAGLVTTVALFALLAVAGFVDPQSRRFRATLLVCALLGTLAAAWQVGQVRPFKLTVATVKVAGRQCLEGSFLHQDTVGVHLVEGDARRMRVIPARDVAGLAIDPGAKRVTTVPFRHLKCPESLRGSAR